MHTPPQNILCLLFYGILIPYLTICVQYKVVYVEVVHLDCLSAGNSPSPGTVNL